MSNLAEKMHMVKPVAKITAKMLIKKVPTYTMQVPDIANPGQVIDKIVGIGQNLFIVTGTVTSVKYDRGAFGDFIVLNGSFDAMSFELKRDRSFIETRTVPDGQLFRSGKFIPHALVEAHLMPHLPPLVDPKNPTVILSEPMEIAIRISGEADNNAYGYKYDCQPLFEEKLPEKTVSLLERAFANSAKIPFGTNTQLIAAPVVAPQLEDSTGPAEPAEPAQKASKKKTPAS